MSLLALALLLTTIQAHSFSHFNRMNVSQEEYTKTFSKYLKKIREKDYTSSYDKHYFLTFTHSGDNVNSQHSTKQLVFKTRIGQVARVERATLRVLVSGDSCKELRFYQLGGEGERIHLDTLKAERDLLPQWRDIEAEGSGIGSPEVRFEVDGSDCNLNSPALHLLFKRQPRRKTRSTHHHSRTDCPTGPMVPSSRKQRCCRHKMDVVFKELPGYEFIIQPYRFDAGYCKGSCPFRYNLANHHASLQSLMWRQKKGAAPKPCCAPSKLEQLEIIHLDEDDPTRLKVSTWTNMKVIECACF